MTKLKLIAGVSIGLIIIIVILLMNKSTLQSQMNQVVLENTTVSVSPAAIDTISEDISIVGTVTADNDVAVISETQGKILNVFVKVGDFVKAGSIIAEADEELKQAAHTAAKVNYEKAKKDHQRIEALYKESNVSDSDLENARLGASAAEAQFIVARRQLDDTKIKASISGTVTDRFINVGTMIMPGSPVANIVDISKLKVKVNIPENDVFKIKTGEDAILTTVIYPGCEFKGKVETISSKADDAHTYPVEVVLPNNNEYPWKAGMFVKVTFAATGRRNALSIPRTALVGSVKNPKVYIVENETAKLKTVVLGNEFNNKYEVISGLNPGESIITSGQNNLTDGTRVVVK
jgi:RND family efflux transporter MFP subunit